MELFSSSVDAGINLLPRDGTVNYYGKILSTQAAAQYFQTLKESIAWKNDEAIIYGKLFVTKRKVAWYGDRAFEYEYSRTKKIALAWSNELRELKELVELKTSETFNSCLLNLYHTGEEGMAWHSDAEKDLKKDGAIASLSFGAERKFYFKHKLSKETISVVLENGSLLVMKGSTQTNWLHRLPTSTRILAPRVNLTFRTIVS